jgi:hypothetical protein
MPVILATWEAEIWMIGAQFKANLRQIVLGTPLKKQSKMDWRCGSRVLALQT